MATTNTKKTATKRAASRNVTNKATKTAATVATETVTETSVSATEEKESQAVDSTVINKLPNQVDYAHDSYIKCRSVTPGELVYTGKKSGISYDWVALGDVTYVQFDDLMAAVMSRSDFVYKPYFVIEDEALINDSRLDEVKKLYSTLYGDGDAREILNLPVREFTERFPKIPETLQRAVASEASAGLKAKTFDSIQKVKVIDKTLGTNLMLLAQ